MRRLETEDDANDLLLAAKALAVVSAWQELGLFEALRRGPRGVGELDGDRRAIEIMVPVLRHLGLVVGDRDRIALSEAGRRLLETGAMPSGQNLEFLADCSKMAQVLKRGGPVEDHDGRPKVTSGGVVEDPGATRSFLDRLYRRSEVSARCVFEWTSGLLPEGGGRVLDLGGGHGRYARLFADAGHSATLFDFPHVIQYAQERHANALSYRSGDFHQVEDFGGPYDLVFLSNIVHGEPPETNASLVQRLARELRPGGHLVVKDMFIDEHGQDPTNAVFFGLTMLFYTRAGQSYRADELLGWMSSAGLTEPKVTVFETFQLVRSRRPS